MYNLLNKCLDQEPQLIVLVVHCAMFGYFVKVNIKTTNSNNFNILLNVSFALLRFAAILSKNCDKIIILNLIFYQMSVLQQFILLSYYQILITRCLSVLLLFDRILLIKWLSYVKFYQMSFLRHFVLLFCSPTNASRWWRQQKMFSIQNQSLQKCGKVIKIIKI